MCVSCSEVNSKVYMRVQSNGMPDHCYGGRPTVVSGDFDVKFIFNQDVSTLTEKTFASQTAFDEFICQPSKAKKSNIPSSAEFTDLNNLNLDGISGFALNGIPIFTASSAEKTDPYYP